MQTNIRSIVFIIPMSFFSHLSLLFAVPTGSETMMFEVISALLGLLMLPHGMLVVDALPGGAAGCPFGTAAVNAPHLNITTSYIVTGPLAKGGLTLVVQDQDVVPPSNTINFMIGIELVSDEMVEDLFVVYS
jgi:hypothetical protein